MDGDFRLDVGEIQRVVENAEVLSVYFPLIRKTLLVDTRFNVGDDPVVKVLPMVDSVEERIRSVRRLRPGFPKPESITVIPWPRYVDSLVRLDIWPRLVSRFVADSQPDAVKACTNALAELRRLELEELVAAVGGQNYHTVWQDGG